MMTQEKIRTESVHNDKTCTISECARHVLARGWCRAHYLRWLRHGDPTAGKTYFGEPLNFLMRALKYEGSDCLLWPFSKDKHGYGQICVDGRVRYAHRVICERVHGASPIPKMDVAHNCGRGHMGCCNPSHLRWATKSENQADRLMHGTDKRGEKSAQSKLTACAVAECRRLYGAVPTVVLAKRYGVAVQTIDSAVKRRSWAWLT